MYCAPREWLKTVVFVDFFTSRNTIYGALSTVDLILLFQVFVTLATVYLINTSACTEDLITVLFRRSSSTPAPYILHSHTFRLLNSRQPVAVCLQYHGDVSNVTERLLLRFRDTVCVCVCVPCVSIWRSVFFACVRLEGLCLLCVCVCVCM